MRRLKDLAKASAIGSTVGLLVSIPLYYWIGVKGIVPTMVLISLTAMFLSWFYSRRIPIQKVPLTNKQAIENGRSMMKMGIAMSISSILVTLFAYVLRWFIRSLGGVDEVGLFTAGFVIVNTYVGMVFTAMSTDYYPRLAAVNNDNSKCKEIINQQGEIAVLILAPIIISCIILMPFLIRLIYTEKFLPANDFITYAVTGTMFKAASWVISFCFLAKAESKLFIINETIANIYILLLNLMGYYVGGLTGLGISFAVGNFVYLIQVYLLSWKKYNFHFSSSFQKVYGVQILFVAISLILALLMQDTLWFYLPAAGVFCVCMIYSLKELNARMNLLQIVQNINKKRII
jgi:PST family polysaccharide transporter